LARRALLNWVSNTGWVFDHRVDPRGEASQARHETYRADPTIKPCESKWEVEIAIKLLDQ